MGSEAEAKSASGRKRRLKTVSYFVAVVLIFGIAYLKFLEQKKKSNNISSSTSVNSFENQKIQVDLVQKKLSVLEERCNAEPPSNEQVQQQQSKNNKNTWTTKPLWLPSYPSALEEATHKSIINTLTGLSAGGKSFYASSKKTKLRQCFGQTETATCSNIHPIVPMSEASNPETKKDKFYPEYIMAIRNPSTAMPSFHNSKAIKYHGLKGQVPIDQWRQHRDTYLHEMMEEWKTVLETWKGMQASYSVGMYLVYEHLWDVDKGPMLLANLANLLEKAGFSTVLVKDKNTHDYDASCVWYNTMTRTSIEQYQRQHDYEYADYVPGYTKEQQNFLMKELSHLMDKYKDDTQLVSILSEYHTHIQFHLSMDQELEQTNNSTKI